MGNGRAHQPSEILKKAREEIDYVVQKSRFVEELDIPNLSYLQATVKETLRLHPTAPLIMWEAKKSCEIKGFKILAKMRLLVNVWATGRDLDYWDNPLEFRHERFVVGMSEGPMDVRKQHFELFPFESGIRWCPGIALALRMVHNIPVVMVQGFEWKVHGDKTTSMVDMEEGVGLTLPRANPLVFVPMVRLHPFPVVALSKWEKKYIGSATLRS